MLFAIKFSLITFPGSVKEYMLEDSLYSMSYILNDKQEMGNEQTTHQIFFWLPRNDNNYAMISELTHRKKYLNK